MDSVQVLEDACCDKAIMLREQVATYTEQAFKMFGGPCEDIILEFDRSLIGAVLDRFGENTNMMATSETKCVASVKVQISPVFWGWLFQFAGDMRIISPENVINQYKERIQKLQE